MYASLPALAMATAALAAAAAIIVAARRRVVANCALRRTILRGDRDAGPEIHDLALDRDLTLTTFTAAPHLVGTSYADHPAAVKMSSRARTGGGFVPFQFVRDGEVSDMLFYVEPGPRGGVTGRGASTGPL